MKDKLMTTPMLEWDDFSNLIFISQFEKNVRDEAIKKAVRLGFVELYYKHKCTSCGEDILINETSDLAAYADILKHGGFKCGQCQGHNVFPTRFVDLKKYITVSQRELGTDTQQDLDFLEALRNERLMTRIFRMMGVSL
jgi:hypothetical protein